MADSSLRLNVIMGMVDKITAPMQKVTSQTERMSEQVKASQNELARLGGLSKDIEHFRKLKRGVSDTAQEMTEAQRRVDALARQMRDAGTPSKALTRDFNRAKKEVEQLSQAHDRENRELEATRRRLNDAGVSTKNLNDATRRIREETQNYTNDLERQQQAMADVANQQQRMADAQERNANLREGALVDTAKVAAGVLALGGLTSAYGDVERARREGLALGIDGDGMDVIAKAGEAFSNQWAGTSQADFIRGANEVKSAIDTLGAEAIAEYTRIGAKMGIALHSTTDEMTSVMATGYGVYRRQFDEFAQHAIAGYNDLSQQEKDIEFGRYFAAGLTETANVFKTDGKEMGDALSNLGATATSAGIAYAEQLAILGQLQLTMSGSESATKYRAFLNSAAKAGETLNLTFIDANNQLRSMPEILDELRGKYGDTIDAVEALEMQKAFGTEEAVSLIKLLYPEVDSVRKNITHMSGAVREGTQTIDRMANTMNEGPNEQLTLMWQRLRNTAVVLGESFAPVVILVAGVIGDAAMAVADLAERCPVLGQVMVITAAAMMGLMTASIVGRFAFAGLSDAIIFGRKAFDFLRWSTIKTNVALVATRTRSIAVATGVVAMSIAQKAAAAGMAVMTAAQWALNVALNANPIGLIVAGIAALVAAVALVYRYWGPLSDFFSGLWDGIKAAFATGWEFVTGLLGFNPLSLLSAAWSPLVDFFSWLWGRVTGIFGSALDWITGKVLGPINAVKDALGGVWNSLFGDDEAGVEVTQRVAQISEATPAEMRSPAPSPSSEGRGRGTAGFLSAPVGSIAASSGGTTVVDQSQHRTEVVVHQQPGQSAQDVGTEVRRQLDERDRENRRRNRGRLSD